MQPNRKTIRSKFVDMQGCGVRFLIFTKYNKVASAGGFLNNIGACVGDKMAFIRKYKFNIAVEDSSSPGYVTEMIMQAFAAQTVSIYYGDPFVECDFNTESFLRVKHESDIERVIEEIIRLNRDDDAYMKVATAQCMADGDSSTYEREIERFLVDVFGLPLETAKCRPQYGCRAVRCRRTEPFLRGYQRIKQVAWFGMGGGLKDSLNSEVFGG